MMHAQLDGPFRPYDAHVVDPTDLVIPAGKPATKPGLAIAVEAVEDLVKHGGTVNGAARRVAKLIHNEWVIATLPVQYLEGEAWVGRFKEKDLSALRSTTLAEQIRRAYLHKKSQL